MLEKYIESLNLSDIDLMKLNILLSKSMHVSTLLEKFELKHGFKFFPVEQDNLNLVVCSKIIDKRRNSYEDESGIVFTSIVVNDLESKGWTFKNKVEYNYYELIKKIHKASLENDAFYLLTNSKRKLNAMINKHLKHF